MAGTTVIFFRSVVDKMFDILYYGFNYRGFIYRGFIYRGFKYAGWPLIIKDLLFFAIILADEFHSRAVVLQSGDSSPMPVWLLSEVETED